MNGTVAEERGDQSPEEWKLRLMQAKALGNTEVREYTVQSPVDPRQLLTASAAPAVVVASHILLYRGQRVHCVH